MTEQGHERKLRVHLCMCWVFVCVLILILLECMCEWTKNCHPSGCLSLDLGLFLRTHWWFLTPWPSLYKITLIQGQQCPYIHPVLVDRNANLTLPNHNQHSTVRRLCIYSFGSVFSGVFLVFSLQNCFLWLESKCPPDRTWWMDNTWCPPVVALSLQPLLHNNPSHLCYIQSIQ